MLNIKSKIIIILSLVAIIISIVAVFYVVNKKIQKRNIDRSAAIVASYEDIGKAVKQKNVVFCNSIKDSKLRDICISSVVTYSMAEKDCELITDTVIKSKCTSKFIYNRIIISKNINECNSVPDDGIKKDCFSYFFYDYNELVKCTGYDESINQICKDIVSRKNAFDKGDKKSCDNIEDNNLKKDCLEMVGNKPADSDKDGLSDDDERSYGFNPIGTNAKEDAWRKSGVAK